MKVYNTASGGYMKLVNAANSVALEIPDTTTSNTENTDLEGIVKSGSDIKVNSLRIEENKPRGFLHYLNSKNLDPKTRNYLFNITTKTQAVACFLAYAATPMLYAQGQHDLASKCFIAGLFPGWAANLIFIYLAPSKIDDVNLFVGELMYSPNPFFIKEKLSRIKDGVKRFIGEKKREIKQMAAASITYAIVLDTLYKFKK